MMRKTTRNGADVFLNLQVLRVMREIEDASEFATAAAATVAAATELVAEGVPGAHVAGGGGGFTWA